MADISTITLPDGNSYNFRDTRAAIATSTTTGTVKPDNSTITVDANGVISASGGGSMSAQTITVTLGIDDWTASGNQYTMTRTISGVTATNVVLATYHPDSKDAYMEAGIYCSAQAADELTFICDTQPSVPVKVNVMIVDGATEESAQTYTVYNAATGDVSVSPLSASAGEDITITIVSTGRYLIISYKSTSHGYDKISTIDAEGSVVGDTFRITMPEANVRVTTEAKPR